ncbi:uncharacterized protein LOC127943344 isoform X5 [Carassius gibelio]|uniref:uncharacterized protein LOC127943344 isoform X5 n=1 Tax=Carassius gibelio TaxID=101364 RepID=UPI002279B238|nr:uncharacterized protein LOC127943344 isoform X5 [Carassius gibelio]
MCIQVTGLKMAEVLPEKPSSDFLFSVCLRFHCVSAHSKTCLNDHSIEDIHLDHTMKIIQLQIYLFMWSRVTESLTNTAVTLGADVIISCDLDIEEIYWFRLKSPDPPELILRTYSSTFEGADNENIIFKLKYSVKTNSSLFIRNISADELGVYYCVKTSEPQKFSSGTKIYISEQETPWRNLTIITSVLLNVLLIIALIGLVKSNTDATGRCKNDSNILQCAENDFSMCAGNIRSCPEQSKIVYRQCMM